MPPSRAKTTEIAAVADYLLAKVIGRGPVITRQECEEAHGDGARECARYPLTPRASHRAAALLQRFTGDRPGQARQGAEVYRANGCAECHTQQVRPKGLGADLDHALHRGVDHAAVGEAPRGREGHGATLTWTHGARVPVLGCAGRCVRNSLIVSPNNGAAHCDADG